jgi:hypothetical protein
MRRDASTDGSADTVIGRQGESDLHQQNAALIAAGDTLGQVPSIFQVSHGQIEDETRHMRHSRSFAVPR